MRFMIIVKANAKTESDNNKPDQAVLDAMAVYHEDLVRAGVLLDANGLQPSSKGWRIRYTAGCPHIVDGPFTETKELVAGYTMIQVRNREEAMEWTRRFPCPHGEFADGEIEVRQVYELEDIVPDGSMERFRRLVADTH